MNTYLLITSIVIFLCILLNRVSNRIGIPALLAFIVLGMLFGSDGIMKIDFDNYAFAEQICSTALIFIMFYGGFGTNWNTARPTGSVQRLLPLSLCFCPPSVLLSHAFSQGCSVTLPLI